MGSMNFERETHGDPEREKRFSFDSSAELAISRSLGLDYDSVDLRKVAETETTLVFDVYGHGMSSEPQSPYLVGRLTQEKASARLARMR